MVQKAVVWRVVIVQVAAKAQFFEEILVELQELGHGRGVGGHALAQALLPGVHLRKHALHIQARQLDLAQAGGGFEQRKTLSALHQAGKVVQRIRGFK